MLAVVLLRMYKYQYAITPCLYRAYFLKLTGDSITFTSVYYGKF